MTSTAVAEWSVRDAVERDAEAVVFLYDQLAGDRDDARPAGSAEGRALLGRIRPLHDRWLLVAVGRGDVVGTADVVLVDNLTHRGRPWAMVENVVVDEARRGQGVGRALMAEVVARARRRSCYKVQLLSRTDRHQAHRFYEAVGFRPAATGFRLYLE